jgi:DNA primase
VPFLLRRQALICWTLRARTPILICMSLPPGFLDELRTRSSLAQVVGRKVMWDQRKSNQGKGDMWAPCPFHQEKTASFHVDDRQGFYYCFGCHAKGDAISFVRETENVGFMEAVEILAREVGMQMPARDPKAREKSDARSQLAEVMEAAVQYYRLQLKTASAVGARDYLAGRGLEGDALDRWDIGFAANNRQGLWGHLREKGIAPELIVDAGLAAKPDDGGAPYDRFRDRIIFPIRDARGRCSALGGRAMSPQARAKYLNSPETLLFDKGRSLFNHGPAREAAGKGQPLIVAEGYMDVIALSGAGFGATVAPLGTAITEHQLAMLWRIDPEPIIALDGDSAGLRAAMRLIDLALPLLEAGKSLRFAIMPDGVDPDDLIRSGGAAAMQARLDQALPMVQLLWRRETEGKVFDSPERKAALDKSLRDSLRRITDGSIRGHYGEAIKALRYELFQTDFQRNFQPGRQKTGARRGGAPFGRFAPPAPPQPGTKSSYLASAAGDQPEVHLREAVILAALIRNPAVLPQFEADLEALVLASHAHAVIRDALLQHVAAPPDRLREKVEQDVGALALEKLFSPSHVQIIPAIRSPGEDDIAALCVTQELAKLDAARGAAREVQDAAQDLDALADEGVTWRLGQAAQARNAAVRSQTEDKVEYEKGANGASVNRDERSAFEQLLDKIDFAKGHKSRD